jgi:Outer membrane protein beta-barrel domain
MKQQLCIFFSLSLVAPTSWGQQGKVYELPNPKRFIDKVEIFAGPNLSYNYGNKFIDDYKSNIFTNKKELKSGYCFGLGLYHPIKSRIGVISINARLLLEQKGTKAKFTTTPLDTGATHNLVQTVESDYSYSYITLSVMPSIYFGKSKKWFVSIGGYYNWLKSVDAHVLWTSISNSSNDFSEQSFKGRNIFGIDPKGGITSFGQAQGMTSFQENDYGAVIGIGYFIPLNHPHGIAIQITDHFGMQDISKQIFGATLMTPAEKNHSINLIICYVFKRHLKKK